VIDARSRREFDDERTVKRRAMQRPGSPIAPSRKIRGTMAVTMRAACEAWQTARRALLLQFFARLWSCAWSLT